MRRSKFMKKVSILIKNEDLNDLTQVLYDLKLIEFFESTYDELQSLNRVNIDSESEELVALRSAITQLKPFFTKMEGAYITNSIPQIYNLLSKKYELEQQLIQAKDAKLREIVKKHLRITPRNIDLGIVGYVEENKYSLLDEFKKKNKGTRIFPHDGRIYFYSLEKPKFAFKEYFIPQESNRKYSVRKTQDELKYIKQKLTILANSNLRHLQAQELKLSKELEIERSKEYFKSSKHHIVIEGFVPADELHTLEIAMQRELANSYHLESQDAHPDEAPVLLSNKGVFKGIEKLVSFYSLPKYREIDPSILMVFLFPLFFGFILGDVGYGVLSLLFFTYLKYKLPNLKDIMSVLQLSAISSIFFGALYGEYFGYEPYLFAFEFHRVNYPEALLTIAFVFALCHINLGLIIGIINTVKYSIKKVFTDYISWMILQMGAAFIYLSTITDVVLYMYLGIGSILVTVALLYYGHGILGIIEIPTLFTNFLSYARLMAIGISSVVIAVLINTITFPMILEGGIISSIIGIFLITTLHIGNAVLGNFESFLQSLRLHYVEFFSKFYEGGGREFRPFGAKVEED